MADEVYIASVYRLTAVNFWKAAETLSTSFESPENVSPRTVKAIPFYFLVSHAAELLLKAALLKRGVTERALKKSDLRHSLSGLLELLCANGFVVSDTTSKLVSALHNQHESHALRYSALVDDGQSTYMPPPSQVFTMLKEIMMLTRISTQGVHFCVGTLCLFAARARAGYLKR